MVKIPFLDKNMGKFAYFAKISLYVYEGIGPDISRMENMKYKINIFTYKLKSKKQQKM